MFVGSRARPSLRLTTLSPSVSPLSRQCGILNISQSHRPPRPITGIAFLYFYSLSREASAFSDRTIRKHAVLSMLLMDDVSFQAKESDNRIIRTVTQFVE
jgi:hypothetical protein